MTFGEQAELLTMLRGLDPTPQQKTRYGINRLPERAPYMGWLQSQFRYLLNDTYDVAKTGIEDFMGRGEPVAYTRTLLWLHSQLNGTPAIKRDFKLRLTEPTPDNRTHKTDVDVFNDVVAGLTDLRDASPLQTALLAQRYRAGPNRCAAFDDIVSDETADARALRRIDAIKAVEQGDAGRYAALFAPDEKTGIAALDMVYCQPGAVTVVRVNTHAGQQAIGGNGKTVHCTSLSGEMGERYFNAYAAGGEQYLILFPTTGRMVAAQFTTGKHEDEANRSVTIPDLFQQEGIAIPPAIDSLERAATRPATMPHEAPNANPNAQNGGPV